jgi:hypothetical protein
MFLPMPWVVYTFLMTSELFPTIFGSYLSFSPMEYLGRFPFNIRKITQGRCSLLHK